jgi:hypothetical protein
VVEENNEQIKQKPLEEINPELSSAKEPWDEREAIEAIEMKNAE